MPWTPQKHKFHPNTAPPCIPWIRGQKDDDETFSHGRDPDCPVELVWVAVEKLCDAPDRPLYNRLTARHNADATLSRVFCNALIWATVFCTSEQSNDKTSTINLQNLTSALKSVGHRGNSSKPQSTTTRPVLQIKRRSRGDKVKRRSRITIKGSTLIHRRGVVILLTPQAPADQIFWAI